MKKIKNFHSLLQLNHTFQAILQMERKQKDFIVTRMDSCTTEGSHWMVFEKKANQFFIFDSLGIHKKCPSNSFTYNQNPLENLFSSACGFFGILYINLRNCHFNYGEILNMVTKDNCEFNEKLCSDFLDLFNLEK